MHKLSPLRFLNQNDLKLVQPIDRTAISTMIPKLSKSHSLPDRLFHLFLLVIGISIGLFFSLCLNYLNFSFSNTSLPVLVPLSISTPPLPPHQLPSPPPPPQEHAMVASSGTYNYSNIDVVELHNNRSYSHHDLMHNMTDDELFLRAKEEVVDFQGKIVPKVAFMFLTSGSLPLAPLWDRFYKGHEGLYSIYVHTHPSYNESVHKDSAFYGRRIPSQPVHWGTISMVDAERRILANALLDSTNQRFVLLSDSCIPLFNFTTVYNYLVETNHNFLASFYDPRKSCSGRYNRQMWPMITIQQWRKGSQWFEVHRNLAVKIISDQKYYKIFNEFCLPPCYNDEHYLPTLVNIIFSEINSNRTITWVDWSRGGPHPRKFGWIDVRVELLNDIRFGSECTYNGNKTNICYLFARKFLPNTLGPLLKVASPVLGFDP